MNISENISLISDVGLKNKTGQILLSGDGQKLELPIIRGRLAFRHEFDNYETLKGAVKSVFSDSYEASFEENAPQDKLGRISLADISWDAGKTLPTEQIDHIKKEMMDSVILKGQRTLFCNFKNNGINDFTVFLFFSKSTSRTVGDLFRFYSLKKEEDLFRSVLSLLMVGSLELQAPKTPTASSAPQPAAKPQAMPEKKAATTDDPRQKALEQKKKQRNALLERLLKKVSKPVSS